MPVRSCENPLPAEARSPLATEHVGTYHRCFKTFQALAQRPLLGLRRFHHVSAAQVCLVAHQHTYSKETTQHHIHLAAWEAAGGNRASSLTSGAPKTSRGAWFQVASETGTLRC